MIRIAFDIGGTFTDLVLEDGTTGRSTFVKTPTRRHSPAQAVGEGLDRLLSTCRVKPDAVGLVLHATTIATNAILERTGSRTGLITTRGFRDVLLIGRQKRYDTYDLYLDKPAPLTQRRFIAEVNERIAYDGRIVEALDMDSVDRAVDTFLQTGIESVAVVLLHAYANPEHEQRIAARIAERAPRLSVTLSSDVSAKIREYERASTTVANAYVKPIVSGYARELQEILAARGLPTDFYVMQSNGGLVTPEIARQFPVRIVESGPAAGVLMAAAVGNREGFSHLLTFDMGGTTAKLGAVDDNEPVITSTFEVDNRHFRRFSGLPLNIQAIELLEIGAGGGSIASTDLGLIKVGPHSAGADPGPICYRNGGTLPTVTDANLVLGYLNPDYFNGGTMRLDPAAAAAGIQQHVADPLGISVAQAAWGIHAIANSNMEAAMRVISVERGRDPRDYCLVAFGGAGPLHAAGLARALAIPRVIVPHGAGVGSALGLLSADVRIDTSLTRMLLLDDDAPAQIAAVYADLEARAERELMHLRNGQDVNWRRYAYLRHQGQGFEIKVDLPDGVIDTGYMAQLSEAFFAAYERNYGYRDTETPIEAVDWQLVATLPSERDQTPRSAGPRTVDADAGALASTRKVYFDGHGHVQCPVVSRYRLEPEVEIPGPVIVEEREATTIALPGDSVTLSRHGHLIISIQTGARR